MNHPIQSSESDKELRLKVELLRAFERDRDTTEQDAELDSEEGQ
jgi:hypothetical protein